MLKTVGLALCVAAAGLVGKKPIDTQHFLIHGNVYEIDPVQNAQHKANDTRVIVYKAGEIYVAFNTNDDGKYLFNLPVGENYTLEFGGDTYVNKRITIDATRLKEEKKGQAMKLNLGLFRWHPGVDYRFLDTPVTKFQYSMAEGFRANQVHSQQMLRKTIKMLDAIRSMHE